jgi:hypothetical protein
LENAVGEDAMMEPAHRFSLPLPQFLTILFKLASLYGGIEVSRMHANGHATLLSEAKQL